MLDEFLEPVLIIPILRAQFLVLLMYRRGIHETTLGWLLQEPLCSNAGTYLIPLFAFLVCHSLQPPHPLQQLVNVSIQLPT